MPCPHLALLRAGVALRNSVHFAQLTRSASSCSAPSTTALDSTHTCNSKVDIDIYDTFTDIEPSKPRRLFSPQPLPPPIIFDGPAQPPNLNSLPRIQHPRRRHTCENRTACVPEPLMELFDGPSRITRRSTRRNMHHKTSGRLIFFAVTAGGAIFGTLRFT